MIPLKDNSDVQGLVARGYDRLLSSQFSLLGIVDAKKARRYLADLTWEIPTAADSDPQAAFHVAMTRSGLEKLGLPGHVLAAFPREFNEGMTERHRQLLLGDQAANSPQNWTWGGPMHQEVDLLFLCYAADDATCQTLYSREKALFLQSGLIELHRLPAGLAPTDPKGMKEHFGFRDGISQPIIEGLSKRDPKGQPIKAGEFVLGYENEYGCQSESPLMSAADDPHDLLSENMRWDGLRDFGRNGSYLVFRQMRQDVAAFWAYVSNHTQEPEATPVASAIALGAKMVGRWPGGAPLALKQGDNPDLTDFNEFGYWKEDPDGKGCPFGAHVRRTNPRDWLVSELMLGRDSESALAAEMVRKHRILRRGRSYGKPLVASMKPEDMILAETDSEERGLHFICLVSDLSRQFEFVQNSWVHSAAFGGLSKDGDPLIGTRNLASDRPNDEFTCQASPVRRKYKRLPSFTKVEGGAYFFLPSLRALRYLSSL